MFGQLLLMLLFPGGPLGTPPLLPGLIASGVLPGATVTSGIQVEEDVGEFGDVGLYTPGTQVAGTKLDNGWVQTADGFVHGAYVKQVDEAPTPPTPDPDPAPGDTYRIDRSVNLRSGPDMRYQVIGVAPRGAEVTGTDVNGWVRTDLGYFWHTFATKVEDGPEDPTPEPPTPPTPPP